MAGVRKKKGRKAFTAFVKDASGVKREVSIPGRTLTEARKNARALDERNWRIRNRLEVGPSDESLGNASARYLHSIRHHESYASTESRWRLHILPALSDAPVGQLKAMDIEDFIAKKRDEGYSQQSRRHFRMTLSAFYKWAIKAKLVAKNPVSEVDVIAVPTPSPKALSWTQVEALRDAAKVQWLADLIWVGAHVGLRYIELRRIRWADVDWKNRRIEAKRAKRIGTRTRRDPPRPASIPEVLIPYLRKMWQRRRGDFMFCYDEGGQLPKSSPDARFKAALKAAGIVSGYKRICRRQTCKYTEESKSGRSVECPRCGFLLWVSPIAAAFSFKTLRSSAITHIIDTTGNARAAQLQVDHADIRTTLSHYHAPDMDVQQSVIDRAFASNTSPRGAGPPVARTAPT